MIEDIKPTKITVPTQSAGGVGKVINDIVTKALEKGASDIHFEHTDTDMVIRFRIDGLLREVFLIDADDKDNLISKIKVSAKIRTDEHFAPQDGRIKYTIGDKTIDTRISVLPTSKGEKVVMRLLTKEGKTFTLEDLGLKGLDLIKVQKGYSRPFGTITVCGPTGSGKTTTLYSILKILNTREKNITTVEDPVEYDIEGVNHVQINLKANLTFANGLRSILRQDPNIIMIGEIRDSETAGIAINAAMTGHLVLTTLHTNDAVTSIPRLIDMGIERYLLASTLNVIIAQRLSRILCPKCKEKSKISKEEYKTIKNVRPDLAELIKEGEPVYVHKGCNECDMSGFKGRVGLFEVLEISEEIKDIILQNGSAASLFEVAKKQGFKLMIEDGIEKLREGIIPISEIIRVTALKE